MSETWRTMAAAAEDWPQVEGKEWSAEVLGPVEFAVFDYELGFRRMALGRDIEFTPKTSDDLGRLWTGFLKMNTPPSDRYWALTSFVFGVLRGNQADWEEYSEQFLELGIEQLVDAYVAGVPVDDLIGG